MNSPTTTVSPRLALIVMTSIFFMWGAITSLNDVLIPHLKSVFELNYAQSMLIQFTFFGAYFVMSLPAGRVVARLGYKSSIVAGLVVAGIGALAFFPAAALRSYPVFLGALFVLASGITLLQVSANPYVSLLGDPRHASSRLNLAQALNSLGHTIAPRIGGLLILSGTVLGASELALMSAAQIDTWRDTQAQSVQLPYVVLALVLFALAAMVKLFRLPALSDHVDPRLHDYREVLAHRHLRLGVIAIFLYVGAEVAIGSFLINYIAAPEIGDMSQRDAALYVSYYWGGAMIGRFVGSALLRRVDARVLLAMFAAVAAALLLTTMVTHGRVAVLTVVAIGLFNSIMFPTIFTLGIERLGKLTGQASSLLIMAIVGGAVIPQLQGLLADRIGVQPSFVLPLLCYGYVAWYGLRGSHVPEAVPAT
jgi:FHS family L-fucose permease-like MFS transporter